eukprot:138372_1
MQSTQIAINDCDIVDDSGMKWSTIATIVYFTSYFLLVILLSIFLCISGKYGSYSSLLKGVWDRKGIYGQIIIHLYDTATDLGVLIEWYLLMKREEDGCNIESLDMSQLFWTAIAFLIVYRVFSGCIGCVGAFSDTGPICCPIDCCLGLIDMYVLKAVYLSIVWGYKAPSPRQKIVQLTEAVFESLPQIILQSIFITKTANDPYLQANNTLYLVGISLISSLFSIANKFTWVDGDAVVKDAKEAEFHCKCPCINIWYVIRILWRFSLIALRFCAVALIWPIVGGVMMAIYFPLSWFIWLIIMMIVIKPELVYSNGVCLDCLVVTIYSMILATICMVSVPATHSWLAFVVNEVEMMILMAVLTLFAFNEDVICAICSDDRNAYANGYIFMLLIFGWISLGINLIVYGVMLIFERIGTTPLDDFFDTVGRGLGTDFGPK